MWGVHFADPSGDDRNDHTHVYVPTRQLLDAGRFGPKLRILDDFKTGTDEIKALRGMYESRTNEALERAGIESRIDISRQDHDPQPRLGRTATALEREAARRQGIDPRGASGWRTWSAASNPRPPRATRCASTS